jgi:3-oxoacyl-[acyl-carrier protein] reductase
MNRYDLNDRVAIVTGGGQGIGLAIAGRLIESGARVSIWDRDQALLDAVAARHGDTVQTVNVDIGKLDSVEAGTRAVLGRFGKIDILVNNAAIIGPQVSTVDYPPQDFMDVVHVGLVGTFFCCKTIVPHMVAANYGRIVNIASIAGKEGNPNAVAYSSMKAGVIALTKSLGKEHATRNIAVNVVTPAIAATPGAMAQTKEAIAYMLQKIPRGRMLELSEVASMVAWLASEENSFTTAGVFDISGGRATY